MGGRLGNAALSLVGLGLIAAVAVPFIDWGLINADFVGTSAADCTSGGACWVFIGSRFDQFMVGFYPRAQRWRLWLALVLLIALLWPLLRPAGRHRGLFAGLLFFAFPPLAWLLLAGGAFGLAPVDTALWGGLMLSLSISVLGMLAALPLGILLALGRRSRLPVARWFSIGVIEFWRGVPLITVLFMASVVLPLFLPEGLSPDKLLRAWIGMALFYGAYAAEAVRGGLQAVPRGQTEAAAALGLGPWLITTRIVLPQALTHAIPGLVNTFINLLKDSTLLMIIGLFDLLGIVQAAATDPAWLGHSPEGYFFVGAIFWVLCFSMSRYSRGLEKSRRKGQVH